jgi:hypothetical protein
MPRRQAGGQAMSPGGQKEVLHSRVDRSGLALPRSHEST